MEIYTVTYNGKISQEAYKTWQEAQAFILGRMNIKKLENDGWSEIEDDKGNKYEIHPVRVKGL